MPSTSAVKQPRQRAATAAGADQRRGAAHGVSFAKLQDLIRGPQAKASPLTLLKIDALATSLKDCLV
jgi:hypothetical protein